MSDPILTVDLIKFLAAQGTMGFVAGVFLYLYLQERKGRNEDGAARVQDSQRSFDVLLKVQEKTIDNAHRMSEVAENIQKERERERLLRP